MKPRLTGPNPICPRGHPLSAETLFVLATGKEARTVWRCLTCRWTFEEAA